MDSFSQISLKTKPVLNEKIDLSMFRGVPFLGDLSCVCVFSFKRYLK